MNSSPGRLMLMDKIHWHNGWPVVGVPSDSPRPAPRVHNSRDSINSINTDGRRSPHKSINILPSIHQKTINALPELHRTFKQKLSTSQHQPASKFPHSQPMSLTPWRGSSGSSFAVPSSSKKFRSSSSSLPRSPDRLMVA